MRIAIHLDLFNLIPERMNLDQLLEKTGTDRVLLCKPLPRNRCPMILLPRSGPRGKIVPPRRRLA
jgi:hypothetical protein